MDRYFTIKNTQMVTKYFKRFTIALATNEGQIKASMWCNFISIRPAKIKKPDTIEEWSKPDTIEEWSKEQWVWNFLKTWTHWYRFCWSFEKKNIMYFNKMTSPRGCQFVIYCHCSDCTKSLGFFDGLPADAILKDSVLMQ